MLPEFIDLMSAEEIAIGQNRHLKSLVRNKQRSVTSRNLEIEWLDIGQSGEIGWIGLGATYKKKQVSSHFSHPVERAVTRKPIHLETFKSPLRKAH